MPNLMLVAMPPNIRLPHLPNMYTYACLYDMIVCLFCVFVCLYVCSPAMPPNIRRMYAHLRNTIGDQQYLGVFLLISVCGLKLP
jgi:hypothetical protein